MRYSSEASRIRKILPGTALSYVPIQESIGAAAFVSLPFATRVFMENLQRRSGVTLGARELGEIQDALIARRHDIDFPFHPGRVVLQDLTGTPALVDLAGLREAVAAGGGDPRSVNPSLPTQMVVDHSLCVEADGSVPRCRELNLEAERNKNAERFAFHDWASRAFGNFACLPPGRGILHQINLEYLSPVVSESKGLAFPDTLIGTDSHTPMINALGVLGWGVGGIEAESVMLGRPILTRLPELVTVELRGRLPEGAMATDLVLALTAFLRSEGVVGAIVEFRGEGAASLSLPDRATVSNMAPEFGATAALFAIDGETLRFLRATGRNAACLARVEAYARAQGLWSECLGEAVYDRRLVFELPRTGRVVAGPSQPHELLPLSDLGKRVGVKRVRDSHSDLRLGDQDGDSHHDLRFGDRVGDSHSDLQFGDRNGDSHQDLGRQVGDSHRGKTEIRTSAPPGGTWLLPGDGALVIAAITSCTNTSNPRSLVAAGLLAKRARERGLTKRPWIKTSFAPGSLAVESYLSAAGLLAPLEELGFGIVGQGCTTCNGMSGGLSAAIEEEILARDLRAAAILSGNRNFNGRIHPRVSEAWLASPALVVALSLAGTVTLDPCADPLAFDPEGKPVRLAELWPSEADIAAVLAAIDFPSHFLAARAPTLAPREGLADEVPPLYSWDEASTYIRNPPWLDESLTAPSPLRGLRPLAVLGDNVTTDDLSPSGAILPESSAGRWLLSRGVRPEDFNSYGTRRGDHLVAVRATLANNRLRNEMVPGRVGPFSLLEPEGRVMGLYEAGAAQAARNQELVIIAGKNYGAGSSRDWAAKGVRLLGVRVVIAEGFERIHRSNLVGMGILPLEFEAGTTRHDLGLRGAETFDILGRPGVGARLRLSMRRASGESLEVPLRCRLDGPEEERAYAAGGLLPLIRDEILAASRRPDAGAKE